jgi:hypothetical protein
VYARGHRWVVRGLALHRPGALGTGRGAEKFAYTECPVCGLAQASNNNCRRCQAELAAANLEAWDAAAFQSWLEEVEPDSEEERQQGSYDVRPHPQQDIGAQAWTVGDWRLELRRQEQIWWINHGAMGLPSDGDGDGNGTRPEGFRMWNVGDASVYIWLTATRLEANTPFIVGADAAQTNSEDKSFIRLGLIAKFLAVTIRTEVR